MTIFFIHYAPYCVKDRMRKKRYDQEIFNVKQNEISGYFIVMTNNILNVLEIKISLMYHDYLTLI